MIEIVKAEPKHAAIVPYLRRADAEEIWAFTGLSPAFAVAWSIAHSKNAWTALLDGKPAVVFGVGESAPGTGSATLGIPWLVATDDVERYPVKFYRESKSLMAKIKEGYDCLTNWVDARNVLSIRWLRWLGFAIEEPEPWGAYGLMFCRFWWKRREKNEFES